VKTVFQEFDAELGIHTKVHKDERKVVFEKTYDAEPYLDYAKALREKTSGQGWGEGRIIGTVPEAVVSEFMRKGIKGKELAKELTAWVRANPKMICFDKFK
jgi:hypothetical protein